MTRRTAWLPLSAILASVICATLALSGCQTTTVTRTLVVTPTPSATAPRPTPTVPVTVTAPPTPAPASSSNDPNRPAGIWCPVINGEMPPVPGCELYPSSPTLYTPLYAETIVAGTAVGPALGPGGAPSAAGTVHDPWAVNGGCVGAGSAIRITLEAWTARGTYYSWGDMPCAAEPSAPFFGYEFRRIANVSVQMTVTPLGSNVSWWFAVMLQR